MSKMYKLLQYTQEDDDFIVMAELDHLVALVNARTNEVHWVTKHVLYLNYVRKALT